ncbi:diguanylate cyclase [Alteromonas sediminis]|uniref:diguanylate cyclase n=1 Tax=Alteromonas sediminis TaxID=2259342 RepID=A0A3N5ZEB9_9ALTE|nr:diguanylate cyclase [Alteromonas sediminis]RPJ68698.1 diguanylate cyclase [Alteromonas sediminis]
MKSIKLKQSTIRSFSYIQLVMLTLFVLVTSFTLTRLSDVHDSLDTLTHETVPTINEARIISHKIDLLMSLTISLANAVNQPSRRIITERIEQTLNQLNTAELAQNQSNTYLYTQVSALRQELNELNNMVEQRIRLGQSLQQTKLQFFDIVQQAIRSSNGNTGHAQSQLTDIMLLAVQIDQQDRLHQLRRIESQLGQAFNSALTAPSSNPVTMEKVTAMQTMLLGSNGMVNQKIELLRFEGRTRGRGNFVKNLVEDVASNLDYNSRLVYHKTQQSAEATEQRIEQQSNIAIIAGTLTVILTLVIIYYLHRRIVFRLLSLKEQVDNAATGTQKVVSVKGKDEIASLANTFSMYIEKVRQQEIALLNMSLTDPLTGIPNRRAFDKQLGKEIAHATRQRWHLSVLLIDVDFFKNYNDHYGHGEGDTCLKTIATTLNGIVLRNTDFCARFGGEEFICILPDTDEAGAKLKAEMLREAIQNMAIEHKASTVGDVVTISIGAATYKFSTQSIWSHDAIIEHADAALYKAKGQGRNRFVHASFG